MIGCLAAHLVSNRLHRTSAFVSTALGLVLVGFGLYSQLDIPIIHTYGLEAVFWAITFGLIIYGACCLERIYSLSFPEFLIFPGNASYSIYLFHTSIQVPAIIIMGRFGKSLNVSCQFQLWAVALVSLLGGIVAYLLIEKPILEKSRIWTGRILFRE
jgi:peptidoglycan/LPS O-acetylase OafA/YrhL